MRPDEYTVIDIETYPNLEMIDRLPEPDVKYGNTKDEDKRQVKYEEAVVKQIDDMALSPLYGKIACVGYGKGVDNVDCAIYENEEDVVKFIFETLLKFGQTGSPKIVTWNGMGFDVPFIYKRALILGVKPTVSMGYFMKRYQTETHCDLMQIWMNWYGYEKLDNVARALLNEGKQDFDVKTIKDLMKTETGRDNISTYCKQDVEITSKLFYKMANILF